MEDDLSGKVPQWKTLLALNHQNICRSTLVESETILKDGRRPPWKTTPILAQPQQSSQLESKLGTAQPQLVLHNVENVVMCGFLKQLAPN